MDNDIVYTFSSDSDMSDDEDEEYDFVSNSSNELKYIDWALVDSTINSTTDCSSGEQDPSGASCLNGIAQGDTEETRDGRQAYLHSLRVDGVIRAPTQVGITGSPPDASVVFVAIVLDTQTNGAQLNSEDVFVNEGGNTGTCPFPHRNLKYIQRFKVLSQKTFVLKPQAYAFNGTNKDLVGTAQRFCFEFPLGFPVLHNGTGNTISSIVTNSLHVIAFSDNKWSSTISYNSRVRFT